MLATSQSTKYEIEINNQRRGTLAVSHFLEDPSFYKIPFEKTDQKTIIKIGQGDYNDFDSFIILSLNDYYKKLNEPNDLKVKEDMLAHYTQLYTLWQKICQQKESNQINELEKSYHKISYGLYLLGYEDKQL